MYVRVTYSVNDAYPCHLWQYALLLTPSHSTDSFYSSIDEAVNLPRRLAYICTSLYRLQLRFKLQSFRYGCSGGEGDPRQKLVVAAAFQPLWLAALHFLTFGKFR